MVSNDNISAKVRVQDDLFRFVNGEWLDKTEIPEDKPRWGSFDVLAENSLTIQRDFLENKQNESTIPKSFKQYSLYMDIEKLNSLGVSPILTLLDEVDNIKSFTEYKSFIKRTMPLYSLLPISLDIYNDLDNPDYNTLHIQQGGIILPDEIYYRDESHKETVQKYLEKLQILLDKFSTGDAQKLFEFEKKIASYHWDAASCRDTLKMHNPVTFAKAAQLLDIFEIGDILDIEQDIVVDLSQADYFENVAALYTEENLDEWKNWAKIRLILKHAPYLSDDVTDALFETNRVFSGIDKKPERWKTAVNLTVLGDEIGELYVKKYFSDNSKEKMDEMIKYLIEAYRISITNAKWLTDITRENALKKLSKFRAEIGFPKHYRDYSALEYGDDLIENFHNLKKFVFNRELNKVGKKADKLEWHMHPQTVNAYYNPPENVIVFPAAILQPPFFDEKALDEENYGGIGAVIGHEIGHGFDDQGAKYNGDGLLEDWWTEQDFAEFTKLTDKLNDQFAKFTPKQLQKLEKPPKVNPKLTTGENVGDLSGLKIALLAYAISRGFESIDQLIKEDKSAVQRFFYAFAKIWRNKGRDEYVQLLLSVDPHSPAEFRANTVRNLDSFHEAFETKPGDELYLDKTDRVDIW